MARLAGPELDLRLLVDERLVAQRVAVNNTVRWHLHDLWRELTLPGSALLSAKCSSRIARRPARAEQTMRVRIARDELRRLRELTHAIEALEAEIARLVAQIAPSWSPSPAAARCVLPSWSARSPRQPPDQRRDPSHRRHTRPVSP